ncbi:MAG: SOS response-associated peptidase [bacterium]
MCGRYVLTDPKDLGKRFDTANSLPDGVKPNYNVAPTQHMPVIIQRDGKTKIEVMHWGIIPVWAKDKPRFAFSTFNARAESLLEKPMWKRDFVSHRCLVPANGFYEWQKRDDQKQPYYIQVKGQPIFAMAGIYDEWTDQKTDEVFTSYTIITTQPSHDMKPIHDRMPVILDKSEEKMWLDSAIDPHELMPVLNAYKDGGLELREVDRRVGNARNNEPALLEPIES